MLTQIDVMSENAFDLPILGVTPKSSLLVKKITGLDPPDKSLFIGDYTQDGGIYQGRRVGNRNVVITIDLNPNPALGESVSGLRKKLYKAFNDPQVEGDHLKMVFHDDEDNQTYLIGYCEKFESDIFGSDTMCQISMICPDPYLRANDTTILTSGGWVQVPFTYEGTAETGFVVRIYVTLATTAVTLANNGKEMQLVNPTGYGVGDLIVINTIRGQRSITLTKASDLVTPPVEFVPPAGYVINQKVFYGSGVWRALNDNMAGGTTIYDAPGPTNPNWVLVSAPIISQMLPTSSWLELHSADNSMRVYGGSDTSFLVANIKYLQYTSAYWGV